RRTDGFRQRRPETETQTQALDVLGWRGGGGAGARNLPGDARAGGAVGRAGGTLYRYRRTRGNAVAGPWSWRTGAERNPLDRRGERSACRPGAREAGCAGHGGHGAGRDEQPATRATGV